MTISWLRGLGLVGAMIVAATAFASTGRPGLGIAPHARHACGRWKRRVHSGFRGQG